MIDKDVASIAIYTQWAGFANPPQRAAKLTVSRAEDGQFYCADELTGNSRVVDQDAVDSVIMELDRVVPVLDSSMFCVPQSVLDSHFGSVSTDDSPSLLVRCCFDNGATIDCLSHSQHAFLLPFRIRVNQSAERESFNRQLSESIARMMPRDFLFRERLVRGDDRLLSDQELMSCIEEMARERDEGQHEPIVSAEGIRDRIFDRLTRKESVEQRDEAECTGDLSARLLRRNSLEAVKDVLSRGADPSVADDCGQTALMHAAFPPFQREHFRVLVEAGADVEARRTDGSTGLHLACAGGDVTPVKEWLEAGADVNCRTRDGATPLMLAVKRSEIVRLLIDAGADVNALDNDGHGAILYLIHHQGSLRVLPQLESLQHLIYAGADLTQEDGAGLTPLDHADQAVRRCEIEIEVQNEIHLARHGELPQRQSREELRMAMASAGIDEEIKMYDTDYDDMQVAEVIRDRLRSHLKS